MNYVATSSYHTKIKLTLLSPLMNVIYYVTWLKLPLPRLALNKMESMQLQKTQPAY